MDNDRLSSSSELASETKFRMRFFRSDVMPWNLRPSTTLPISTFAHTSLGHALGEGKEAIEWLCI